MHGTDDTDGVQTDIAQMVSTMITAGRFLLLEYGKIRRGARRTGRNVDM